jgi:hypothetical protein
MESLSLQITIIRSRVFIIRGGDTNIFLSHFILVLVCETKLSIEILHNFAFKARNRRSTC